jgi:hypothetical protein
VFDNGKLVLCLTNNTNIGYVDVKGHIVALGKNYEGKLRQCSPKKLKNYQQNILNYLIPDITINIELQSDLKTIILSVSGLNLNISKNIIALSVKDRATIPNTSSGSIKTIFMVPNPVTLPLKINCGGDSILNYLADQDWSHQKEFGVMDGSVRLFSGLEIGGTDEDEVYQSEKYGMVTYKTRVPNGLYKIKLMFAENYFTSAGKRIFDVTLEQNKVLTNLDIYNQVGMNNAYEVEFDGITVQDGILDIYFESKLDNAVISGIVITPDPNSVNENKDINKLDFNLEQNFPNPFNGMTQINYTLNSPDNVSLLIYDILGEQIFFKDLGFHTAGSYNYLLDSKTLSDSPLTSGVYFYVFKNSIQREIRKFILLN